jgi:hypothetical protein
MELRRRLLENDHESQTWNRRARSCFVSIVRGSRRAVGLFVVSGNCLVPELVSNIECCFDDSRDIREETVYLS